MTNSGQPRRSRAEMIAETTEKLLRVARRRFTEVGYAAISMDALCAEAGLTRGALYHHFGGKEGLLEAVVRQIDQDLTARLKRDSLLHKDPWRALRHCCQKYLELAASDPEIQRVMLRDAPAVLGQRFRDLDAESSVTPLRESLHRLMEEGIVRRTDAGALAVMLNGALLDAALLVAGSDDPGRTLKRAQRALDVLLSGLREGGE